MLTRQQAEALVIARLESRCSSAKLSVAAMGSSERSFGWVFAISLTGGSLDAPAAVAVPQWVIVNKHSRQVVASTVKYDVEQFVRLYEKLLSQSQARSQSWCGTLPMPFPWSLWRKRTVAERAKDDGFYEISGKEGEP